MSNDIPLQWKNGRLIAVMDTELTNLPGERWKDIPDFTGYQMSNYGRIKALERYIHYNDGRVIIRYAKILKLRIERPNSTKNFYVGIEIRKNKQPYRISVPKMVYYLFVTPIDLDDRSLIIKKKDNDFLNCHYKNLRVENPKKALKYNSDIKDLKNIIKKTANFHYPGSPILSMDLTDLPRERWIEIEGYDGQYQLSDYGRIKSAARTINAINGNIYHRKEYILKCSLGIDRRNANQFSAHASLLKNKTRMKLAISRLVYYYFVSPFDMEDHNFIIHRKDNNNLNCYYTNLQLNTVSETISNLFSIKGKEIYGHNIKPVNQYDKNGIFLRRFESAPDAAKETGVSASTIKKSIRNKSFQGKMFYWQLGEAYAKIDVSVANSKLEQYLNSKRKPVQKISLDGEELETYTSIYAATLAMGYKSIAAIQRACNKPGKIAYGYH